MYLKGAAEVPLLRIFTRRAVEDTFFRAVLSEWKRAVTGEHSAIYWLIGLLVSIVIPMFALDQTSNIYLKISYGAGTPIVLFISSIIFSVKNAWKKEQDSRLEAEKRFDETHTVLLVEGPNRFQRRDSLITQWRVMIVNTRATAARNVQVRLISISPRPKWGSWREDFPYYVEAGGHRQTAVTINPKSNETYELFAGWPNPEGEMFTEGLDTKDIRNRIGIDPDERWTLGYEVISENAPRVEFSITVYTDSKTILAQRNS
jgi:hypothetical protein